MIATRGLAASVLSQHGSQRQQQRGVRFSVLSVLVNEFDREQSVGGGCVALTVSRRRRAELRAEGLDSSTVDALGRHVVVLGSEGVIVTVCKLFAGTRGRAYRRGRL